MSTLKQKAQSILDEKDLKILPENIKKDMTVFGVTGTLESLDTSDANATSEDIAYGKTAYVNGEKVTGKVYVTNADNRAEYDDTRRTPGGSSDSYAKVRATVNIDRLFRKNSYIDLRLSNSTVADIANLHPAVIKKGYNIRGVVGAYEGITDSYVKAFKFPSLAIMADHHNEIEFSEYAYHLEDINEDIDGMKAIVNKITTSEKSIVDGDVIKWDNIEVYKEITLTKEEAAEIYYLDVYAMKILNNQYLNQTFGPFLRYSYDTQTIELCLNNDFPNEDYSFQYTYTLNEDESVTYTLSDDDYNNYKNKLEEISKLSDYLEIEYGFKIQKDHLEYNLNILNKFIYKKNESLDKYALEVGLNLKYSNLNIGRNWQVSDDLLNTLSNERPRVIISSNYLYRAFDLVVEHFSEFPEIIISTEQGNKYRYEFDANNNVFSIGTEDYISMLDEIHNSMIDNENEETICVVNEDTYRPDLLIDLIYSDTKSLETYESIDIYEVKKEVNHEGDFTGHYRWIKSDFAANNIDNLIINTNFNNIGCRLYYDDGNYYESNYYGDYKLLIEQDNVHPIGKFMPVSLSYTKDPVFINLAFYWKYLTEDTNFPFSSIILMFERCNDIENFPYLLPDNCIELYINDAIVNTMNSDLTSDITKDNWSPLYTLTFNDSFRDINSFKNIKDIIFRI